MSLNLNQLCRACLRFGQVLRSPLESIVPKIDSPPSSVVEMWQMFSKVLIATEDSFPDKICDDCLDEIQRTYSFMLKCTRSEDILKKMKNTERLTWLGTVSPLHELNISKNVKIENDWYENIESNDHENDKEDAVNGQTIIQANVEVQADPQLQHTLIVQHEDDKLRIEELDHLYCGNGVAKDEARAVQEIKQEPELDICTEKDEFTVVESEDQTNAEILACPGCRFEFGMIKSLEKHIMDDHMKGQMCELCNHDFECTAVEHCSKHLRKSTDQICLTGTRPFNCERCSKSFLYKRSLMRHIRSHTGARPFKCEICPKEFFSKDSLMRHIRSHTGERPFQCETCSKTFIRKQTLIQHLKGHSGERPFQCEICPKTFLRKHHLMEHSKCHTSDRPFKCEICPKTYRNKPNFIEHLKCHTGERSYKCEICLETFQHKQGLKYHVRCHTGERPFKCESCPQTFIYKYQLLKHLRCHTIEQCEIYCTTINDKPNLM